MKGVTPSPGRHDWLRAANWRDIDGDPNRLPSPVRAFLERENAHCAARTAAAAPLRELLFAELRARQSEDDCSVPLVDGPWAYYHRIGAGEQYHRYCRRPRAGGEEQLLLDANARAGSGAHYSLAALAHSPDHRRLALAEDRVGDERYRLQVIELSRAQVLLEIADAAGDLAWAADSEHLFYTALDAHQRPDAVWCVSVASGDRQCVYRERDPGFFVAVDRTLSGRFVVINSADHTSDEPWVISADQPLSPPRRLRERRRDQQLSVHDWGDHWIVHCNADGALDYKLQVVPIGAEHTVPWRDWYLPAPGVLLEQVLVFAGFIAVNETEDARARVRYARLETLATAPVWQGVGEEPACGLCAASAGLRYATAQLHLHIESPIKPPEQWALCMDSGERRLLKRQPIPSGHCEADYRCERLWARGADGESIPLSVFHRADTPLDGSAPGLLYGYGAYGVSSEADFSAARLSLLDRGFVCAIAHVRGGMERGYRWYLAGRAEHKHNSFEDFIACAERLIEWRRVSAERLACYGGSAGGLLVGAVLNQRPALFAAAVADVPFVDVLATMSDASLPLTPMEWPEWGNPIEDPAARERIARYSPVDNVRAGVRYPHLLVLAGLSDPRVTYWEPAKWVARLRECAASGSELLLRTNMNAGHSGASGRYEALRETAFIYAFLIAVLGVGGS